MMLKNAAFTSGVAGANDRPDLNSDAAIALLRHKTPAQGDAS
jgi:hypothetical protein